jgi:hypothetical protein
MSVRLERFLCFKVSSVGTQVSIGTESHMTCLDTTSFCDGIDLANAKFAMVVGSLCAQILQEELGICLVPIFDLKLWEELIDYFPFSKY